MSDSTRNSPAGRERLLLIALGLVLITVLAYARTPTLGFLANYDDALYVTGNPQVQEGLTWSGVVWAFSSGHAANWHPLTWVSHMLDVTLFGLNPAAHHLVNLLIHLANVVLLFVVLHTMTRRLGPSAVVAALWAVHPLHVESVAWVAERKDVLSALFWLLALWAYERYTREDWRTPRDTPRTRFYLLTLLFMACGLMAKPMVVTLPFALLLLDYWPLKRMVPPVRREHVPRAHRSVSALVLEKMPMFLIAAGSAAVTMWAQERYGAVQAAHDLPLPARLANAAVAYVQYLGKTFLPIDLAAIYPHPGASLHLGFAASAAMFLLLATLVALVCARRAPYLIVGWLWFLGVLVPVIGVVQVGSQAIADRYTYLPHIGLFILMVWLMADALKHHRRAAGALTAAALAALVVATFHQTRLWREPIGLFRHTLAVTGPNPLARVNLGTAYLDSGLIEEALAQFDEAARLDSDSAMAHYNRGVAMQRLNRLDEAREAFENAVALDPSDPAAHNNLGLVLAAQGENALAFEAFVRAIAADPQFTEAHLNLGSIAARAGDVATAEMSYKRVLERNPRHVQALINLGNLQAREGALDQARANFEAALAVQPANALAHYNLAVLLHQLGDEKAAEKHLQEAKRLRGESAE